MEDIKGFFVHSFNASKSAHHICSGKCLIIHFCRVNKGSDISFELNM